jgi:hypothetical protein
MTKPEEYLKKNVKDILQPLVKELLSQRPDNAVNN